MDAEQTKGSPLDELVEITERMRRDKARLEELCRVLFGIKGECAAKQAGVRKGRLKAEKPPAKRTGRASLPGDRESWKKVVCSVCKQEIGSRVYEGQRYPVLHKDPSRLETCKGSFAVAELAQ